VVTDREEIEADAFIIATGGLSFPYTGSTGDGYRWARKAGHDLVPTEPALCPVKIAERFDSSLSGLKLKNVRVTLVQDGKAVDERFGEMDFTPFGISGAIIMDMASSIGNSLKASSDVSLQIDLKPALDPQRLDARIDRDFTEFSGDALRFALRKLLPGELIPEVIKKARLDMGKPCGETTPDERASLRDTLKNFKLTPTGLLGFHHAIITSGGVRTDELNAETMGSKMIPNVYFAGEIIDIDGPTGGFNLQECWTTGYVAGSAAAESLGFSAPSEEQIIRQMVKASSQRMELNARERQSAHPDENVKEGTEEMTIKTGPAEDREFCGWRGAGRSGTEDARDKRFERPDRAKRPYRPRDERFDRSDRAERPYRPRDERFDRSDRAERPYRPRDERFDRSDRSERPYRPRDERFDRPDRPERPYRPRDERFDRSDRPERPYRPRDERFDRSDRSERPYRPRDERFDRSDRTERPYRPRDERFDRSDRPERPYRPRDERFDRSDRSKRPYRPRDERFDRSDRAERPYRPRDERFDCSDRSKRPYRPRDERFDRSDRAERPYRPRDERFDRSARTERPYRSNDAGKDENFDRREERPRGDIAFRRKKPFRRFTDFEHFRKDER
ncbi:MAG: aminoacetone oxidase family FAD-binding enzyme, partial [Pyramidobacter sp.]|jgi:hypothetical protein